MKHLKKLLVVLSFVLLAGALTACSQMNRITSDFEDQGYVRYKYNNVGDSVLFSIHDALAQEEFDRLDLDELITTTTDDGEENTGVTTVTTTRQYLLRFVTYAFSNDDYVVLVMEFESEDYLNEVLGVSAALEAALDGLDEADYINGNCLLIVPSQYSDNYDEFVEIFQGRAEPLPETSENTEAATTEASTTATDSTTDTTTTN